MDPQKEANYIFKQFLNEWIANFNIDGWILMVRWREDDTWELCAAHPNLFRDDSVSVGVRGVITRDEWIARHSECVDECVEQMHAACYLPQNQAPAGDVAFRAAPWWGRFVTTVIR